MFVYSSLNEGGDTITDFTSGQDLIDLRRIFTQAAFQVTDASDLSRFQRFIQLVQVGADTQVQIDADGAGTGTGFATLATLQKVASASVTSRNFVVR